MHSWIGFIFTKLLKLKVSKHIIYKHEIHVYIFSKDLMHYPWLNLVRFSFEKRNLFSSMWNSDIFRYAKSGVYLNREATRDICDMQVVLNNKWTIVLKHMFMTDGLLS